MIGANPGPAGPTPDRPPSPDLEHEPPAVAAVFGERVDLARRYARMLAGPGVERGLIGPREAGRLWTRHLLNCAVLAELIPEGARVVDIGSGAGLPGIPLALVRQDIQVDLVEPLLRRSVFLTETIAELGLSGCRVVRLRSEDAVPEVAGADVVTARAVAPLARLARWTAPLLRPGGLLLAIKGSSAGEEVYRDRAAASETGIMDLTIRSVGGGVLAEPTTVVTGRRVTGAHIRGRARRPDRARGVAGR